ncbi:MAG: hypothetical protein JSS32_09890 [Verrucomicrobia bacterium]|nr:hypothetical protein [Verrucomicrobiota bacterium]
MKTFCLLLFAAPLFAGEWADETLASLTLEEKVGQLFVVSACPTRGEDHWEDWDQLIDEYHVGGLLIKQGTKEALQAMIDKLQKRSPLPLLVAADAEWGLGMTSIGFDPFPKNMTLGAIEDLALIQKMGYLVGTQCRSVGVHLNLAPVVDVNNNPDNPIIHMRSFGEDPTEVATRGEAFMEGLHEAGVMACAKHFPGHGDTTVDSHISLPTISGDSSRLELIELAPFQYLSDAGIDAVMTGHLLTPAIDPKMPSSLSSRCIDLLRNGMNFQGLIITDALNMKGVADDFSPEEIAVKAHTAGNDLLLYGSHIAENVDAIIRTLLPKAYGAILNEYKMGRLPIGELDKTVLRILEAKEKIALTTIEFDPAECREMKRKLFQAAATLLGDAELREPIAYLGFGSSGSDLLAEQLGAAIFDPEAVDNYKTVVVGIHNIQPRKERYNISPETEAMVKKLSEKTDVIVCLFGTPYALRYFEGQKAILIGYEDNPDAESAVLEILKGDLKPQGHLPLLKTGSL